MYFSLIKPKEGRERDAAHEWARGPYAEHQWLWQFFPAPEGTRRDFLFRRWDIEGMPKFYVVSKRPPKLLSNAWNVQTHDYAPKLEAGARLGFDLRANPVVAHSGEGKHARHDVVMQEKKRLLQERGLSRWKEWEDDDRPALYTLVHRTCGAWLRARASRLGFQLDEASLAVDGYQQHKEGNGRLRFSSVDLSGKLTVVGPTAFGVALRDGVGPAKAFGCGLMLVRRI
ncbi:MAG: type I-E CRISPR-associated protein Cas6/Cse3/CasE [Pseudomonadota bacterium]|nr:type I-E CRISPR-associated protein Cas6/Cse3/CasE [Pseudomonadota bacterium]